MHRNLYILAASLLLSSLIACGIGAFGNGVLVGLPGDNQLWRTAGLVLLLLALLSTFGGMIASLMEQAIRRHTDREIEDIRARSLRTKRRR